MAKDLMEQEKLNDIKITNKKLYQTIQNTDVNTTVKPPLGVKLCYIQAEERIKDLADAVAAIAETPDNVDYYCKCEI